MLVWLLGLTPVSTAVQGYCTMQSWSAGINTLS